MPQKMYRNSQKVFYNQRCRLKKFDQKKQKIKNVLRSVKCIRNFC